jgi:cytochrome c peroxidase
MAQYAPDVRALQELGQRVFFDDISAPARQACASCHVAENGWTGPSSRINKNGVAIPGANRRVHAVGGRKPPSNAYASFSPPFGTAPKTNPNPIPPFLFPIFGIPPETTNPVAFLCSIGLGPFCTGGVFWDGRAEGGPTPLVALPSVTGEGATAHVGLEIFDGKPYHKAAYEEFVGPVADQALGPFPNDVEQNVPDTKVDGPLPGAGFVCRQVKNAKYAELFTKAWGQPIKCSGKLVNGVDTEASLNFKRIGLAISAWQASPDVNSFSSRRDKGAKIQVPDPVDPTKQITVLKLPFTTLTPQENLGHDLFYGRNDTGNNLVDQIGPDGSVVKDPNTGEPVKVIKNANCAACHNSHGFGSRGDEANQIYSDHAYHHIGVPANFDIENFDPTDGDAGLAQHADPANPNGGPFAGHYKTPTLRNVDKRKGPKFVKAFMHNGYFKTLEQVVHFYNTSLAKRDPVKCPAGTTAAQAMKRDCWPTAEFDTANQAGNPPINLLGNLGLTADQEAAIVAYLKTLTDTKTPAKPKPYKAVGY